MALKVRRSLKAINFGVNTNVVITGISQPKREFNKERTRDLFEISVAKLNEKGRKKQESTFAIGMTPKITSDKFFSNFESTVNRIYQLMDLYVDMTDEEIQAKFDNVFVRIPKGDGKSAVTFKTMAQIQAFNWTEDQLVIVFDRIADIVEEVLEDHLGVKSIPVNVKVVYNNKERIVAPMFGNMFEEYTSDDEVNLKLSNYDKKTQTNLGATRNTLNIEGDDGLANLANI